MNKLRTVLIVALVIATPAFAARRRAVGAGGISHPLLEAARKANEVQYNYAQSAGAQVLIAPDNSTFALYWSPHTTAGTPVIVTLHGSDGFATAEFYHWHPLAVERGYAVLALQWWLGEPDQYLDDPTIYALISQMLERVGAPHGRNLLHGFSRGSARSYAITFLDRSAATPWFLLTVANAGGMQPTYPLYADIDRGWYGANVFADTRWILYCGENDPQPEVSGCVAMRETQTWLTRNGGVVLFLIQDPTGSHGGFQQNPDNMRRALDSFGSLLAALAN